MQRRSSDYFSVFGVAVGLAILQGAAIVSIHFSNMYEIIKESGNAFLANCSMFIESNFWCPTPSS